jgi:diacylglycerol kinase (ATP)
MLRNFIALINRRYIVAGQHSYRGLKDAFLKEEAFRVQVALSVILVPLAYFIANNYQQLLMLIITLILVLIVELLNTAIEIVIDRIGPEFNDLSGRAKDIGSAAVALSMLLFLVVWGCVLVANVGVINT